jgi:hypothetical protein
MRAIVLCLFGTLAFAATPEGPKPDDQMRQEVNVLRAINTAAVQFEHQNQRPATWEELVAYMPATIKRMQTMTGSNEQLASVLNFKDAANFYPGHTIRWTVPASGKGWDVVLTRDRSKGDSPCSAPTWFSNDRGIIYQGYSIDCRISATKAGG